MDIISRYESFIDGKKHLSNDFGIDIRFLPDMMFDYQKEITEYATKKGRCAVFLDTGLGKTLIELTIAKNYASHTGKPVLLVAPLAVAFQFVKESEKFGIDDVSYSKDGSIHSKIVVCNYDRLDKFDSTKFDCVILDESSILKNFDGAIKENVTAFMRNVKYRYLFTATPSPNDFVELGTSSEALGYMGYTDMLTKYFTNNEDTIKPQNIGTQWILKGHAVDAFFEWVSSWSISMRRPSDLGYSDEKHQLPELHLNHHVIANQENMIVSGQIMLINSIARRLPEVREENKLTIVPRCEKAYELARHHDVSVYWCNLNQEGDMLQQLDKSAEQIKGSMHIDEKEDLLINFFRGDIKRLITKPKMTAFGLNWQHCNHTTFFPTFSYEQYYQAIRRFWRFGQQREVTVDLVYSDGQKRVIDSLLAKAEKSSELFEKLNGKLNASYTDSKKQFDKIVSLPTFI